MLTVWKLDRLGRNTQHVLAVVDDLTSRGIGFRSLTEGLHTDGPMGTAMLTITAAFAQLERDTMIERTRAGLVAAAANGRKGGRPRKVDDADAAKARQLREKGITASDIAKMLGSVPRNRVPVSLRGACGYSRRRWRQRDVAPPDRIGQPLGTVASYFKYGRLGSGGHGRRIERSLHPSTWYSCPLTSRLSCSAA